MQLRYAVIEILVYYMGLPPHPRMPVTIEGVVWHSWAWKVWIVSWCWRVHLEVVWWYIQGVNNSPLALRLKFLPQTGPSPDSFKIFRRSVWSCGRWCGPLGDRLLWGLLDISRNPHWLWLIVSPTIMDANTNAVLELNSSKYTYLALPCGRKNRPKKYGGWSYVPFWALLKEVNYEFVQYLPFLPEWWFSEQWVYLQ